jgi:hypothetical protein
MSSTYADILGYHGGDHQDTVFRLSTPKMETEGTSEKLVRIYETIRRHIAVILRISHSTILECEEPQQTTKQGGPSNDISTQQQALNNSHRLQITATIYAT